MPTRSLQAIVTLKWDVLSFSSFVSSKPWNVNSEDCRRFRNFRAVKKKLESNLLSILRLSSFFFLFNPSNNKNLVLFQVWSFFYSTLPQVRRWFLRRSFLSKNRIHKANLLKLKGNKNLESFYNWARKDTETLSITNLWL